MTDKDIQPLTGVRVLDLSTVVAGPFGAEILASLGAEVIRVSPPPAEPPRPERQADDPVSDADGFLYALQRNKKSVCLDLKDPAGRQAFLDLVKTSDVVYDNFRPGVLERLSIDYAHLKDVNPGIISCSINGFGADGPWGKVGAYDITVQALSGAMSITGAGDAEAMPCRWGVPVGDIAGAFYAVIGVLAALEERSQTGRGQAVEVSLLDGQLALNTYRVPQAFGAGVTFDIPSPRRGGAGAVPYGPFRGGDGSWVVIAVASNFWRAFCDVIGMPELHGDPRFDTLANRQANQHELDAILEERFLTATAEEWQTRLIDANVPVGKVNTIKEAFDQPQAQARGMAETFTGATARGVTVAASPIRFTGLSRAAQQAPVAAGANNDMLTAPRDLPPASADWENSNRNAIAALAGIDGPLRGIMVLELCGDEPSGTFGTQILADLGATVVKIERPPKTDPTPTPSPAAGQVRRDIAYYFGLNRNKRSICLDLKQDAAKAVFHDLVKAADVIYDNYKPSVLTRLGLDPDTLHAINPHLICCSVSGYGKTGPWSALPAYDATIQALGGGMSLTGNGEEGSPPVRWGNPIGGIAGAFYGVIGALAALRRRKLTGAGSALDIALLDAQLAMHAYRVAPAMKGRAFAAEPRRGGSGALPYGPFLCGDARWFVLGITGQFWKPACDLLGHPEWADDPRFADEAARQANEDELNRLVGLAMLRLTSDEWQEKFVAAGIPGAKVRTIPEAFTHPHVERRDMLVGFDHPVGKALKVAGSPVKLSGQKFSGFRHAPALGEDTADILSQFTNLDTPAQKALRDARAAWWSEDGDTFDRPSVV